MSDRDLLEIPGWEAILAAGEVAEPSTELLNSARVQLSAEITADEFGNKVSWMGAYRKRVSFLTIAACGATAAALILPIISVGESKPASPAAAAPAEVLNRAADAIAIHAVDPPVRPGQFWHIRTDSGPLRQGERTIDDKWIATNGKADGYEYWRTVATDAPVSDNTFPELQGTGKRDPESELSAIGANPGPDSVYFNTDFINGLPRDPAKLALALRDLKLGRSDGAVFHVISMILSGYHVPSEVRAAMYRVLASLSCIQISTVDATVLGRRGFGFDCGLQGSRISPELVIDPDTGELIGQMFPESALPGEPPTAVRVTSTLVDSVPAEIVARVKFEQRQSEAFCRSGHHGC